MYTVCMEKECNCFKNSHYKSQQHFKTESEALSVAKTMAKEMTSEFCKEHAFAVVREENNFLIILMH